MRPLDHRWVDVNDYTYCEKCGYPPEVVRRFRVCGRWWRYRPASAIRHWTCRRLGHKPAEWRVATNQDLNPFGGPSRSMLWWFTWCDRCGDHLWKMTIETWVAKR